MAMASLCMKTILEHLLAMTYKNSKAHMEEQSSSPVCSALAGALELRHKLWGWVEQLDVMCYLNCYVSEPSSYQLCSRSSTSLSDSCSIA